MPRLNREKEKDGRGEEGRKEEVSSVKKAKNFRVGMCGWGFRWIKQADDGYRCVEGGGGIQYISDAHLGLVGGMR